MPFQITPNSYKNSGKINLGYVPLVDASPLIIAKELGFFEKEGLQVDLNRQLGWGSLRDSLIYTNNLDGAHAHAGMALGLSYGLNSQEKHFVTGYVLNCHGNGITLSSKLLNDSVSKYDQIERKSIRKKLMLGFVHPFSTHHYFLRVLLKKIGLKLGIDAEFCLLPPEQMPESLKHGHIDGFCVGEPWNSVAISEGTGRCIATSEDLCKGHPEKVLLVSHKFSVDRHDEHLALIRAVNSACKFIQSRVGRTHVIDILSRKEYLDIPKYTLEESLFGAMKNVHCFYGENINRPDANKANLILSQIRDCDIRCKEKSLPSISEIFRDDLYDLALTG